MTHSEKIKKEALTIKAYLHPEDKTALFLKATAAGLTVPELLENFIGDLVGMWGNGSDERGHAEAWFNRCWFSDDYYREITFSMWLSRYGNLRTAFNILEQLETIQADIDAEKDPEELEALKDDLEAWKADLEELYEEYAAERLPEHQTKQDRGAALEDLKKTLTQYRAMNGGGIMEDPQEGGKDD